MKPAASSPAAAAARKKDTSSSSEESDSEEESNKPAATGNRLTLQEVCKSYILSGNINIRRLQKELI